MTRLRYSYESFLRRVQIGKASLWVLVEGPTDRAFLSEVLSNWCEATIGEFDIATSDEVDEQGQGKKKLLNLFRKLRADKSLSTNLGGPEKKFYFFLDKDIDDLLRIRLRNKHLQYSNGYSIECDIVSAASIELALSRVAGATRNASENQIGGSKAKWLRSVSENLKLWVAFCIAIRSLKCKAPENFGVKFPKTLEKPFGKEDEAEIFRIRDQLVASGQVSKSEFDQAYSSARKKVEKAIRESSIWRYVNGKWLIRYLVREALILKGKKEFYQKAVEAAILAALLSDIDVKSESVIRIRDNLSIL